MPSRSMRLPRLLVLLAVLGMTVLALTPQIQAFPRCPSEFYYYSDESHAVYVGYALYDCQCNHFLSGQQTPYYDHVPLSCP